MVDKNRHKFKNHHPYVKIQDIKRTYVLVIEQFLLYNVGKGFRMCFCKRRVIVEYKEKIIEMVNEIDCESALIKIYSFILAFIKK